MSKMRWQDDEAVLTMMGTLRKINITDDLVMKVAREQFARCNNGDVLDDQREYIRVGWVVGAGEILDDFNALAKIFKKIDFKCDVNEFYEE